ncbi:hypothetical protein JCGZ_13366 [Jatropha curcas]|uniref:Uncharacterized protein n=1 Tax=Jatropha curcas TaxID=180498 RepID=A0A067K871_JATCU|nr:hypothetical protein JCGZ_13366 [Jatropha curcas]
MEALYPASEYLYYPPPGVFTFKEIHGGGLNVGYLIGGGSTIGILLLWSLYVFFKKFTFSVGCNCSVSNNSVIDIESQL